MKRLIKIFLTVPVLCLMIFQPVFAAGLEMTVEIPDQISAGDEFSVQISYEMDMLDSVKGSLEYDTDEFEYISGGTSEGNGGLVEIRGNGEGGKASFTVIFKAKKPCSGIITVSTKEAYDLDGKSLNCPVSKETVTAIEKQEKPVSDNNENKDDGESSTEIEITETENNGNILPISIGITAVLLVALIIIAAVRRKG